MKSNLSQVFKHEPFDPNGAHYQLPNRIWEPGAQCGCGECRFHKPRKCPAIIKANGMPIETVTLWASKPR